MKDVFFPPELFRSLKSDELVMLLYVASRESISQSEIHRDLGIGIRKSASILYNLSKMGLVSYKKSRLESTKVSYAFLQEKLIARMPLWILTAKDLWGLNVEKTLFSYLYTFSEKNGDVIKKRYEMEEVLGIPKNTVNHALNRLETLGFLGKRKHEGHAIAFKLHQSQKTSLLKGLFGA